jgi:hypothetical protein
MIMAVTSYHGTFYTASPEIIEHILRSWLSKNNLQMKPHRGFQMHYETDGFELYCYDAGARKRLSTSFSKAASRTRRIVPLIGFETLQISPGAQASNSVSTTNKSIPREIL